MANVVVSRIQNRRGHRKDLPQPLDPGELGFCTDTGQLFIGAEWEDSTGFISPVIECFTPSNQSNEDANTTCEFNVIQIDWADDVTEYATVDEATDAAITDITDAETAVGSPPDSDIQKIITEDTGTGFIVVRAYLGYLTARADDDLPGLGLGTERFFTDATLIPSNRFENSTLAMDTDIYVTDDSYAVAEIINYVYTDDGDEQPGLVTVYQNIEVITEATEIVDTLSNDLQMPGTYIVLNGVTTPGTFEEVPEFAYDYEYYDTFTINYSVSNGTSDEYPDYSRSGKMTITCGIDTGGDRTDPNDLTAIVTDSYTELDNTTGPVFDLEFEAGIDINAEGTVIVKLYYTYFTANPDSADRMAFVTNNMKWKSFSSNND